MALIKNSIAHEMARDAVVLDLGDLRRQGEAILRQARAEAERIVVAAKQERVRIVAGGEELGRAEGYAKGLEEGRAEGREQALSTALSEHAAKLEQVETAWTVALAGFAAQRDELVQGALRDVLSLAVLMAERIVKRTIEVDPRVVEQQLAAVLGVVVRPTELLIRIHPEDRATVEKALPRLMAAAPAVRHAEIVEDVTVERGGCTAKTRGDAESGDAGGGEIDATIRAQLDRIIDALLPRGNRGAEPGVE